MASYTTQLLNWGEQGTAYPSGYSYTSDVPPIEEYDDFAMYNLVKDVKHLVSLTNERIESSSGSSAERPSAPEDGHQFWNTEDSMLEIYDAGFGGWKPLALGGDFSAHVSDTTNPHDVTAAQVGAPTTGTFTSHRDNTANPHDVTAAQAGASPSGHNHDGRYVRQFDGAQVPVYSSLGNVPSGIGPGEAVYITGDGLYMENNN